ncbi:MAG: amidohydrolase family protein [Clostridiales bacterium]|jgi:hypothetical protein|nr:amidohydrolase family protein [Clostridiales bacterium]
MLKHYTDYDRNFYMERLNDFLPEKIVDVHTHVWRKEFRIKEEASGRGPSWPSLAAEENTFEDMNQNNEILFPGKKIIPLVFGKVSKSFDIDKNNEYIAQGAKKYGYPALCVTRPEWDAVRFENEIKKCGNLGAKVYLNFSPDYIPSNEIRIYDFITPTQLEVLHENKWVLMLHIPRPGRLKDPVNLAQLIEISNKYSGCSTIVAHIGRAYCNEDVGEAFTALKQAPNLYYDFSANTNDWVMEQLIKNAGSDRILYGSDAAVNLMKLTRICENGTYVNIVPEEIYGDVSAYSNMRSVVAPESEKITFFAYGIVDAFRRAAFRTGLSRENIKAVFFDNAAGLLGVN